MRYAAWTILIIAVVVMGYSAYLFAFFAWVTATPVTPSQLAQAQLYANAWFMVMCVCASVAILDVVFIVGRYRRRPQSRGFDVIHPEG